MLLGKNVTLGLDVPWRIKIPWGIMFLSGRIR